MSFEYPDDPTDILRDVLSLEHLGPEENTGFEQYLGQTPPQAMGRVFGGQVMAQSMIAANNTVDQDRFLHSMHCYFVRAGDASEPIRFSVQRIRDGRSFSVRQVQAIQHDKVILQLTCSFQIPTGGFEHQDLMPQDVPDPEDLLPVSVLVGQIDHPAARELAFNRPFDIRHITEPIYLRPAQEKVAYNAVWMKTYTRVNAATNVLNAALAYGSDYSLLEPIMRKHGVYFADRRASIASLDHAMWFHRPVRVDEWLLYVQQSPSAQSARGLGTGRIFNREGQLVATVAQEGMLRVPEA